MGEITCEIFRGGRAVFTSYERGITPLIQLIESGTDVSGGVARDKIVGRAAALLYAYMRVKEVRAGVLSEGGKAVLAAHKIAFSYETLTPDIINRRGNGQCPMEIAVTGIDEPARAYAVLRQKINGV